MVPTSNPSVEYIACPECHRKRIPIKRSPKGFACGGCGYILKCSYCGAGHSLTIHLPGTNALPGTSPYIECKTCSTKFWDEIHSKPKSQQVTAKPKKQSSSGSCAYCGDEDPNCPYAHAHANAPKSARAPKPSTKKVAVPEKSKLIVEPETIRRIARTLLHQCPVCKGQNIAPTLDGMRCSVCKAEWPVGDKADHVGTSPMDSIGSSKFWDAVCPKCNRSGVIIHLASGELQCGACSFKWGQMPKQNKGPHGIQLGGGRPKDRSAEFRNCCEACKAGFIQDGRCLRCGAKAKVCSHCAKPFTDKSQTQGLCEKCRPAESQGSVTCPNCHRVESTNEADLYCRCGHCENEYAVRLRGQVVDDCPFDVDDGIADPQEAGYHRYKEKEGDVESLIDDALSFCHQIADTVFEGKDPTDDITELESAMERLGEIQRYIKEGSDVEPESEDIWTDDDDDDAEQQRARWLAATEHQSNKHGGNSRIHEADYNEVSIEDAGDELLSEEIYDLHDKDDVGGCPQCGGDLDSDGYCTSCFMLLNSTD